MTDSPTLSIASFQLATCLSCGGNIYWFKNDTIGRTAPIDASTKDRRA